MRIYLNSGLSLRGVVKVNSRFFSLALALCCLSLAACGESQETKAVCSHAAEFESSLVATSTAIDGLANIAPRQLQSTLAVLNGSLSIIKEFSPSSIKNDISRTSRAYDELSVAFQNVDWNGQIASIDANVQNAISNLTRNDNVEALESIRSFIEQECRIEFNQSINALPENAEPLVQNSIDVEPGPDLNYGFDNETTAIRSYAFFIALQRGISLTEAQADCLGARMISIAESNPTLSDESYESALSTSFSDCSIKIK